VKNESPREILSSEFESRYNARWVKRMILRTPKFRRIPQSDYFPKSTFEKWWVGAGLENWQGKIHSEAEI
jgi:hypothetical protein